MIKDSGIKRNKIAIKKKIKKINMKETDKMIDER